MADMTKKRDINELFRTAEAARKVGVARKTRSIDARPAKPGEIITTFIAGEGKETRSKPAEPGDMVVRNRCLATGSEEYLVSAKKFAVRYGGPYGGSDAEGWREYRPIAPEMFYFIVDESEGDFVFTAPWGEDMIAKPGDAIVRNPDEPADTYRVSARTFECTYEIIARGA